MSLFPGPPAKQLTCDRKVGRGALSLSKGLPSRAQTRLTRDGSPYPQSLGFVHGSCAPFQRVPILRARALRRPPITGGWSAFRVALGLFLLLRRNLCRLSSGLSFSALNRCGIIERRRQILVTVAIWVRLWGNFFVRHGAKLHQDMILSTKAKARFRCREAGPSKGEKRPLP